MPRILFIFGAEGFERVAVRHQVFHPQGKRPRVGLRIVNAQIEQHGPEIDAVKALGKMQGLAVRVPSRVEPAAAVEAIALDYERVSVPASTE